MAWPKPTIEYVRARLDDSKKELQYWGLDSNGFVVIDGVVNPSLASALIDHFQSAVTASASIERNGSTFAMRNLLLDHLIVRHLADSSAVRSLVDPVLGANAIAVRGILFDKTPGANWKVPWHQDLSIAVTERIDLPGYGPWSVKAGVVHVQPPAFVLENMLTIRLHLDDCGEENGPLLVLPGSHAHGVLGGKQIDEFRTAGKPVACIVKRGGAVVMRPLLMHASRSATTPGHRRVVHLEYAAAGVLAAGLRWFVA
jgi:ectoine hydroxylase-related dioxygenase (phytanoyl-CoA dioxygenase family)